MDIEILKKWINTNPQKGLEFKLIYKTGHGFFCFWTDPFFLILNKRSNESDKSLCDYSADNIAVSFWCINSRMYICDYGVYYAINITNGDLIFKHTIPLSPGDLVEFNGVVIQPSSSGDDFLLIGGNITILYSNYLNNTLFQKSFIDLKFPQLDDQWSPQIASYDSINNIVYLNAEYTAGSVLLKFDYNQKKEDVITLSGNGLFIQSSYNESTGTIYLGGPSQATNQYGQMVVVTYNTLSGDMSSTTIKFDHVPDSCYYSTELYQHNSNFFAGLRGDTGD
ncbi:hypothetical protein DFA_11867 [Cavenderia fasciculata]|uniref:Uncharacterized protein n=1 Tax=Cavenderia fasciculata TaxID=261658 RepID=F4QEJ2_CACFS|nr:uncharacterized protein DFA_11867 [Cavenderia fasciculata]EGG14103.1 hypothetical protein DFA_11867 [Cavenderia fasciculata]|eukprot:XP_004350811.1 hypothetical protein DFA_11867 [Cavenderia fasciculata]